MKPYSQQPYEAGGIISPILQTERAISPCALSIQQVYKKCFKLYQQSKYDIGNPGLCHNVLTPQNGTVKWVPFSLRKNDVIGVSISKPHLGFL